MKKHKTLYLTTIAFSLMLALNSCMVGPKFQSPEVPVYSKFMYDSIATDTIINLEWWKIFNDNKLKSLIDTALKYNKDVQIAAKRIEESAYIVGYNKADLWPAVGYNGSVISGNIGQNGAPLGESGTLYGGTGNIYWELDFWGKYRRATEAAKAELLASEYGMKTVQIGLITNVANLYFQLIDYRARLTISEETHTSRLESLRIISARFDKGIIPEIDLNQAQIQEAIAAANIPYYERFIANSEHALKVLLGQKPGKLESTKLINIAIPDSIPSGIPSLLLARRPDIEQAKQLAKAQNARIGIAQAMRFPSIGLTGAFGAASSDLSSLISSDAFVWSAAGSITGPIFNFGKNKRRVEIERARTEQLKLEYENVVIKAFAEVEDALIGINTSEREMKALDRQVIASINASKLSQARYDGGVTSYLEVLETQRQLFESQLRLANAFSNVLNSYVQLYKALGGGWNNEIEMNKQKQANTKK